MRASWCLIFLLAIIACGCDQSNNLNTKADTDTRTNITDEKIETSAINDQLPYSTDLDITRKIRKAIKNDLSLTDNTENIKVITQNGVVILRGVVNNNIKKRDLEDRAQNTPGVIGVKSFLEVMVN